MTAPLKSFIKIHRCRDEVINDSLSVSKYLLVPFHYHVVTSLHPPSSQRIDFSTYYTYFIWGKAPIKMRCMQLTIHYALVALVS